MFYLANDVIQHAKRKSYQHYLNEFKSALKEVTKFTKDDKIIPNINRVLNIWEERAIYPKEFVEELRNLLNGEEVKKQLLANIVSGYASGDVIKKISSTVKVEQQTRNKLQNLINCEMDFSNAETLNKLKDKTFGEQLIKKLNEAKRFYEEFVLAVQNEINNRKDLIADLERCKLFNALQQKEVQNSANTYANSETLAKQAQAKLAGSSGNNVPANTVSSLDKRLNLLMSGSGFTMNTDYSNNSFYQNAPQYDPYNISHENLEHTDMDLANSDDDDDLNKNNGIGNKTSDSFSTQYSQMTSMLPPSIPPNPQEYFEPNAPETAFNSYGGNDLGAVRGDPIANLADQTYRHSSGSNNSSWRGDNGHHDDHHRHHHRNHDRSSNHHHHNSRSNHRWKSNNNSNQWNQRNNYGGGSY